MTTKILFGTALAGVFLAASSIVPAAAAPNVPALSHATGQQAVVQEAGWRCGPRRCTWVPNYWGPVPPYATTWGPPARPNCYWKKGILGNWKYKCDD